MVNDPRKLIDPVIKRSTSAISKLQDPFRSYLPASDLDGKRSLHDTSFERVCEVIVAVAAATASPPPFPAATSAGDVHGDLVAEEDGADAEGGQEEEEPLGVDHVRAAVAVAATLEVRGRRGGGSLIVAQHARTSSVRKARLHMPGKLEAKREQNTGSGDDNNTVSSPWQRSGLSSGDGRTNADGRGEAGFWRDGGNGSNSGRRTTNGQATSGISCAPTACSSSLIRKRRRRSTRITASQYLNVTYGEVVRLVTGSKIWKS